MKGLASEIMLSLKDCLEQKEGNSLQRVEEPGPADIQPAKRKMPRRGWRGTLMPRGTSPR